MGNRANVIFADDKWKELSPSVYLHWNGGPESVYAFLAELDRRGVRADQCYEAARFAQIVGEFLDNKRIGGTSLGLMNTPKIGDLADRLARIPTDSGDNGFYIVCRQGKELKVRRFVTDWEKTKATDYKKTFLNELSPNDVERERMDATKHKYAQSLKQFYQELTKGKDIEELEIKRPSLVTA